MRILIVINSLRRGGAERVVSTLSREWTKSHHVTVAVFDSSRRAYDCAARMVDLHLPARPDLLHKAGTAVARSIRLIETFRRLRPDLIVTFMESANFPAIVAAFVTGLADCLRISVRSNPSMFAASHRALIPFLYRVPRMVIAPSRQLADELGRMGVPPGKLATIPNPVVIRQVEPLASGSPFPHRFIMGAGRLRVAKGFDRLLAAFSRLGRRDVHLVVLGDGSERRRLVGLADALGVAPLVHFPGAVQDIGVWYRHAECFILSSRYEGWPNVLAEAMANGCPVVSYSCRYGPEEIIQDGHSGLLVDEGDIDGLRDAILRVMECVPLRNRLADAARKRVREFAVERIAPRWLR